MPEYDFYATVRSDLDQLQKELAEEGVQGSVDKLAERLGVPSPVALAAAWRASKRHGETLGVFLSELGAQTQRETARQSS
jgi:hypothetical protein